MRPLLAALLLLPAVALGQTLTVTVSGAGTSGVLAYNASGCSYQVAGAWVGTSLTSACTTLQIWTSISSACGALPSTTNVPADYVVYTAQAGDLANGKTTDTFTFAFTVLPSFTTYPCGQVVDFTNYLCAAVTTKAADLSCTGTVAQSAAVSLRYDNVPPDPPLVTVSPLDSKLSVRLTPSGTGTAVTDIQSFQVFYAPDPGDGGVPTPQLVNGNVPINNPSVTISPLVNGTNYLVYGTSVDEASNVSVLSPPYPGQPVVTYGFYANYLDDGGAPSGGCGDAAGGAPSALAFATLLLLGVLRRRG